MSRDDSTTADPRTGTSTRMKVLPHSNISSIQYHSEAYNAPLSVKCVGLNDNATALEVLNRDKQTSRKCVYTYEDKYTFSRILTADSLVFDSHFESGNLHSAFRIHPNTEGLTPSSSNRQVYDVYMHPDVHTSGHTQWFFFSVSNTQLGREVVFNIRNFAKPDSMFNRGMRPLLFSTLSMDQKWVRCGHDITYFGPVANDNFTEDAKKKRKKGQPAPGVYTMTFSHIFGMTGDTVYFAFCHPYSYTDLQVYLHGMERKKKIMGLRYRRTQLCRTLAGNRCDLLTVTAPASCERELTSRVLAVITCRVHPGETNSSWMMQGILDFLMSDTADAKLLRNLYVFKIVPMLNPDGVINGNYRTSLSGSDLNRRWSRPDKVLHPTIHHTKEMIRKIKASYKQCIVMDLHGHSTREGIFIYGCVPDRRSYRPSTPMRSGSDSENDAREVNLTNGDPAASSSSAAAALAITSHPGAAPSGNTSTMSPVRPSGSPSKRRPRPVPQMHVEGSGYVQEDSGLLVPGRVVEPLPPYRVRTPSPAPPAPGEVADLPRPVPTTTVMRREYLEWKVKLFPRILATVSDMFLFNSCSFKVHRSKASTMRIVNFIELGIDCVYTIEASLAGLSPSHFSAPDLVRFGGHVCTSLLEVFPMLAPNSSPYMTPGVIKRESVVTELQDLNPSNMTLAEEIQKWQGLSMCDNNGIGLSLMSEAGIREMTVAAISEEGRDDDDSDIDDVDEGKKKDKDKDDEKEGSGKASRKSMKSGRPPKARSSITGKAGAKAAKADKDKDKGKEENGDEMAGQTAKAKKKKKVDKDKQLNKSANNASSKREKEALQDLTPLEQLMRKQQQQQQPAGDGTETDLTALTRAINFHEEAEKTALDSETGIGTTQLAGSNTDSPLSPTVPIVPAGSLYKPPPLIPTPKTQSRRHRSKTSAHSPSSSLAAAVSVYGGDALPGRWKTKGIPGLQNDGNRSGHGSKTDNNDYNMSSNTSNNGLEFDNDKSNGSGARATTGVTSDGTASRSSWDDISAISRVAESSRAAEHEFAVQRTIDASMAHMPNNSDTLGVLTLDEDKRSLAAASGVVAPLTVTATSAVEGSATGSGGNGVPILTGSVIASAGAELMRGARLAVGIHGGEGETRGELHLGGDRTWTSVPSPHQPLPRSPSRPGKDALGAIAGSRVSMDTTGIPTGALRASKTGAGIGSKGSTYTRRMTMPALTGARGSFASFLEAKKAGGSFRGESGPPHDPES